MKDLGSDAADVQRDRHANALLALLFATVASLTAVDLATDLGQGVALRHAVAEGAVIVLAAAGAAWMMLRLRAVSLQARRLGVRAERLAADLDESRAAAARLREDAERWRREAGSFIAGLGAAIDEQLVRWQLTDAEQAVALLLLKGLSHKEIAGIRGTNEATVRQQSRAIYRKAGLSGRHDLAAFFLEDLLEPRAPHA